MKDLVSRYLTSIVAALAAVVLVSLVVNVLVLSRIGSLDDRLAETEADVTRIEGGTALFATQIGEFQAQLAELAPAAAAGLDEATTGLEAFRTSTIRFTVPIDQTVPVSTEVVLDRTLTVPIRTTVPIDRTVSTTITVSGPLGAEIPVDVTVPIRLDIPVDLDIPIAVNETIPIEAEIPIKLDIPIAVDVAGTELAGLATSLQDALTSFKDLFAALG